MSKLMNLLRRNPRMTMAGVVLVIVLVAVVIWMVTRDKKPESTGPQLEVTGEKIVKSTKMSEYAYRKMEYADPASAELRGWNIDFTITVETKGGFKEAGIKAIKIERYDDSSTPVLLDTQYINDITNYTTFTTTFLGISLTKPAVGTSGGKNTFKLYGVTTTDNPDTPVNEEVLYSGSGSSTVLLASSDQNIPQADLNYTLSNATKTPFTFNLGSDSGSTLPNIESSIIRTRYRISIDPSKIYSLVPNTNQGAVVNGQYKFKNAEIENDFLAVGTTDVFKIDMSYGQGIYRAYTTDGTKILTREDGTGDLVLKSPTEMNLKESKTSLMTFAEPGELDGVRIIGIYPGDDWTPERAIGNMSQSLWSIGTPSSSGVTFNASQFLFYPSETFSPPVATFGTRNDPGSIKVTFETIDPVKNVYMLKDDGGNYVSYGGNNTAKRTTKVDLDYAITFEKQTKTGDNQIQKYLMKTKDGVTIWPSEGWLLNGNDSASGGVEGKDRIPLHVVVFKYETGKPDGSAWSASPMTYYSCASDKDVGCNGAPSETNAGQGTGYVNQSCYAGSYMYC